MRGILTSIAGGSFQQFVSYLVNIREAKWKIQPYQIHIHLFNDCLIQQINLFLQDS